MRLITNISITERAAVTMDREKLTRTRRFPDDIFALVYMSSFVEADGTTVKGFRPGYRAVYQSVEYIGPQWLLAHLPGGMEFHFDPLFIWDEAARYVVDLTGGAYALFSIEPEAPVR